VRRFLTRVFLVSTMALPATAWAQAQPSGADRATARALAHEGVEAQKHGQYDLAVDRFQRASALVHAPTLLLGLARAQVATGKLVEANETYQQILREPLGPGAPAAFVKAVDEAKHDSPDLAARLSWVTLAVVGPPADSVVVQLDGVTVPSAAVGVRLACNPGAHVVKASATGFDPAEQHFAMSEAGQQTISVTLRAQPAAAPAPTPAAVAATTPPADVDLHPPSPSPEHRSSWQKSAGIGALTIGAIGLVGGGVTGVLALTRHASLSDECPGGHCSSAHSGDVTTYRTLANVSTVATIVGAAGTVAGITLLLTSPSSRGSVDVYAGALDAGIAGRF
jgi:Tetratricopeptide repeat